MAIMYQRSTPISRGSNRSAVSAAAYRSSSKMVLSFSDMSESVKDKLESSYHEKYHLVNENTGEVIGLIFDYRDKSGAIISGIMAPSDTPEWVFDRQKLWQSIENAGSRVDSRLAHEHTIALPIELTKEQNKELVKDFVSNSLVARGMVVDYNIHLDNPENPHVHIMTVTRDLETNIDGEISWGKVNLAWKNLSVLKAIRAEVAVTINRHLEMYGHEARVSHLSHAARGLDIIAGIHEGPARWIKKAQLKQQNHEIALKNAAKIIADPTIVIDKLSIDKPVFSSNDIEKSLHKALIAGINPSLINEKESFELWSKSELLSMYNTVVASDKLTLVNPCDLKGRMLFARTERLELENRFEGTVRELATKTTHSIIINEEAIAEIALGVPFSKAQKQAIIDVLAGGDISVLEGWPGSGKTTVMREIVRQYKLAGYNVIGSAPTNKASEELSLKTGIEAENTTKLRQLWQQAKIGNKGALNIRTDYYKEEQYQNGQVILPGKTILIIDEASMVDLPVLDYFTHEIRNCGGKLIKLGDNNQNPAIGYKGGFSKTGDIAGRIVLMENNRHQNQDEYIRKMHIEATKAMGCYNIAKAISIYENLGMIRLFDNEQQKQQALANDYASFVINSSKEQGDSFALAGSAMAAFTNEEVDNLNSMVRQSLKNAGIIKGEGRLYYSSGGEKGETQEGEETIQNNMIELCLGDQIIFKSNKQEFEGYGGVRNNELGIITKLGVVDENGCGEFEVKVRDGNGGCKSVKIKTGEDILPISFRHGYALTGHAVQGTDVNMFFYSVDKHSGYEAFNVGSSRHRDDCLIYVDKETLENVVYKTKDLDISRAKEDFRAYAYKYQKGDGKWEQVDVPLWKVGLKLLIAKRTDLNFAKDYAGQIKDNRKKSAYQEIIANNQDRLNKLYDDLNHWKKDKETPLIENNWQIASDSKESEQLAKQLKTMSVLEFELAKYFILQKGGIIINPLSIAKAAVNYNLQKSHEGQKLKSVSGVTKKINEHVTSLKLGAGSGAEKEKLKWVDLGEIDKNLIIRLSLSKKDLSFLARYEKQIKRYEEKIISYASKIAVIHENLAKQVEGSNKLLSGNLRAMREYLDSRERVIYAQKIMMDLDLYLKKPAIEKQLSKEAFEGYGIKATKFNLTASDVIRAETAFSAKHFHKNSEKIEQLKKEKDKPKSAKELKELFNIELQKDKYLRELLESNHKLTSDDRHLIAGVILKNSELAILKGKYQSIEDVIEELNIAKLERQNKAEVIVHHYNGFVRDDLTEKVREINNGFAGEPPRVYTRGI
jgi:MobA/MobL family/AAA domain